MINQNMIGVAQLEIEHLEQEKCCLSATFMGRKITANITSTLCCPVVSTFFCLGSSLSTCCSLLCCVWQYPEWLSVSDMTLEGLRSTKQAENRDQFYEKFWNPCFFMGYCEPAIHYSLPPERQRMADLDEGIASLNELPALIEQTFPDITGIVEGYT